MLDPQVTQLLESAVNTSCKLAIVLTFLEHSSLNATSSEIASRVCRDMWSVDTALNELVEDGILTLRDKRFCCEASCERRAQLIELRRTYEHPLLRNEVQERVRDLERYAPYRKDLQFFHSYVM
jgi:transcription initiation factor IIE alpha subunit